MHPVLPYIAAVGVAVAAGTAKAKHFPPPNMGKSTLALLLLVILASAAGTTRFAPVVNALGMLLLLASVMAAVPVFTKAQVVATPVKKG